MSLVKEEYQCHVFIEFRTYFFRGRSLFLSRFPVISEMLISPVGVQLQPKYWSLQLLYLFESYTKNPFPQERIHNLYFLNNGKIWFAQLPPFYLFFHFIWVSFLSSNCLTKETLHGVSFCNCFYLAHQFISHLLDPLLWHVMGLVLKKCMF